MTLDDYLLTPEKRKEVRKLGKTDTDRQIRKKIGLSKKELKMIQAEDRKIRNNKIKKYLTIGAIVGASIFGGSSYFNKNNNALDTSNNNSQVSKSINKKPFDEYISEIYNFSEFSNDKTKPTVYFIFQQHSLRGMSTNQKLIEESIESSLDNQLSVYRIIEHLYENKNLQLVCSEGIFYDDNKDIESPNSMEKTLGTHNFESMTKQLVNDYKLTDVLRDINMGGGPLVSLINQDLYLVGFEEREKNFAPDFDTTDPKNIKKLNEYFGKIDALDYIRSEDALKYALEHSKKLNDEGITSNNDVAIVMGIGHLRDFHKILSNEIENNTIPNYKPVFIIPKGIEEGRE